MGYAIIAASICLGFAIFGAYDFSRRKNAKGIRAARGAIFGLSFIIVVFLLLGIASSNPHIWWANGCSLKLIAAKVCPAPKWMAGKTWP
jgi:hypothetical protein